MAKRTKTSAPKRSAKKSKRPANPLEPNRREAIDLALKVIAIPGTSGQEKQVADYIAGRLRRAGAPAAAIKVDKANERAAIAGNTGNLILKLKGNRPGPRRLLMAHIDTVPICVGCEPVLDGDVIRSVAPDTGLGGDDRAGASVILHTALAILKHKLPHPPLTFAWMIQEEVGLQGARCVDKRLLGNPQLAFNWDGGSPAKLTIGATGGYRMTITIRGIASHAGVAPEEGVSAITIAALAIADLQQSGWHGDISKKKGTGTSNVGLIEGGAGTNVVADRVVLRAEARSHDAKFRKKILQKIEKAFRKAAEQVTSTTGKSGEATVESRLDYESFLLKRTEPSVVAAQEALQTIGLAPEFAIANGGLDANWMALHGIPTVTLGCGQHDIHTVNETLNVEEYLAACRVSLRLAVVDSDRS
jgi:tripeptide aminopeptidase